MPPLATIVDAIREQYRLRCDFHSAEKRLTNQIKSIGHRLDADSKIQFPRERVEFIVGAVTLPLEEIHAVVARHRMAAEKSLEKLAKQLPVWKDWAEGVRGIGALGVSQIVGECGDLSMYANPAKVWKRMGVGMYQRQDGGWERQRKAAGADGVEAGYSPRRRSVLWNVEACFIKAGGPYREVYDVRKAYEATKPNCGRCPEKGEHCRPAHIHNRASRYMGKRFLRDLWRAWRAE